MEIDMALAVNDKLRKGNEVFVEGDLPSAVEHYTRALIDDSENPDIYAARSHAFLNMEQYEKAVDDADQAIAFGCKNNVVYLRKGIALLKLKRFAEAKDMFLKAKDLEDPVLQSGSFDPDIAADTWISKCNDMLLQQTETCVIPRYDWYQTEAHVVVTVLFKDKNVTNVDIGIEDRKLQVKAERAPELGFKLELSLAHDIVPAESTKKIFPTKIEVKLKKREGIRWSKLEGPANVDGGKQFAPVSDNLGVSTTAHKYPTSNVYRKDWNKIATELKKEEESEKVEGESAMNELFEKIYADGSDEVKRAMNKSFSESGGTVLSTNWKEVAAKTIDVKPPDGLEYRKWD